jgi:hypothetical protein
MFHDIGTWTWVKIEGVSFNPHPLLPKLITPIKNQGPWGLSLYIMGPPLSPLQVEISKQKQKQLYET